MSSCILHCMNRAFCTLPFARSCIMHVAFCIVHFARPCILHRAFCTPPRIRSCILHADPDRAFCTIATASRGKWLASWRLWPCGPWCPAHDSALGTVQLALPKTCAAGRAPLKKTASDEDVHGRVCATSARSACHMSHNALWSRRRDHGAP